MIASKKQSNRKRAKQFNFRTDGDFLKMLDDLKIAHPKLHKTDIIHEAVKRWHQAEFR